MTALADLDVKLSRIKGYIRHLRGKAVEVKSYESTRRLTDLLENASTAERAVRNRTMYGDKIAVTHTWATPAQKSEYDSLHFSGKDMYDLLRAMGASHRVAYTRALRAHGTKTAASEERLRFAQAQQRLRREALGRRT